MLLQLVYARYVKTKIFFQRKNRCLKLGIRSVNGHPVYFLYVSIRHNSYLSQLFFELNFRTRTVVQQHSEIRENQAVARRKIVFIFHRCTHFSNFSLSHRSHRLPFDVDRSIKNRATTLDSTIFPFKSSLTRQKNITTKFSNIDRWSFSIESDSIERVSSCQLKILFKKKKK